LFGPSENLLRFVHQIYSAWQLCSLILVSIADQSYEVQYGDTALLEAATKGHIECVRLLLEHGAEKDVKNNVRASAEVCFREQHCAATVESLPTQP
jgi:ankyrin repeat protein